MSSADLQGGKNLTFLFILETLFMTAVEVHPSLLLSHFSLNEVRSLQTCQTDTVRCDSMRCLVAKVQAANVILTSSAAGGLFSDRNQHFSPCKVGCIQHQIETTWLLLDSSEAFYLRSWKSDCCISKHLQIGGQLSFMKIAFQNCLKK